MNFLKDYISLVLRAESIELRTNLECDYQNKISLEIIAVIPWSFLLQSLPEKVKSSCSDYYS